MRTIQSMRLCAAVLLLAGAAFAGAEVKTVQAMGEAAIDGTDGAAKVAARKEARKAAFRNAVENVAGTLVSAYSLTQDNVLVSDRIFTNAQGYVKNPRDEKYEEKGGVVTYRATVDVHTAGIEKDLQAIRQLVQSLDGSKIVVLVQEQTYDPDGVLISGAAMTEVVVTSLKKEGWTVIDPSFLAGQVTVEAAATMGPVEAKKVGNLAKADYVIYGKAAFRQHKFDKLKYKGMLDSSPVFAVSGEYSFTVFDTHTGTVLGVMNDRLIWGPEIKGSAVISYERTTQHLVTHSEPKIISGVRKLIYTSLGNARQNGNRVVVEVLGLEDLTAVDDFKDVLRARQGVTDIKEPDFANGKAMYDVVYAGKASELARQFKRTRFQKRRVRVTGRSGNKVELTVAR